MTPKEKAEQLERDFTKLNRIGGLWRGCALRLVDEVIEQWEYIYDLSDMEGELNPNLQYWYEVKQELEKL